MRVPTAAATLSLIFAVAALGACGQQSSYSQPRSVMDTVAEDAARLAADNLKEAEDFLADNRTKPGVTTTDSGLQYAVVTAGAADGPRPAVNSVVQVNYAGTLLDGTEFDSSFARGQAAEFEVGQLIPGWVEALQLMRPGDEWTIWVHPRLGYGEQGAGNDIGPNKLLVFRMRLEGIVGGPGASGSAGVSAAAADAEAGR
jgi:FKBP-type peptidyl-prolyl cis-trans isomerase FklB